jgi:hypothetical protein
MKKNQGKYSSETGWFARRFDGYRCAISVTILSFSASFKKLRSTNCSGLALFACGICDASMWSPTGKPVAPSTTPVGWNPERESRAKAGDRVQGSSMNRILLSVG